VTVSDGMSALAAIIGMLHSNWLVLFIAVAVRFLLVYCLVWFGLFVVVVVVVVVLGWMASTHDEADSPALVERDSSAPRRRKPRSRIGVATPNRKTLLQMMILETLSAEAISSIRHALASNIVNVTAVDAVCTNRTRD
jgi:hypothetical protein